MILHIAKLLIIALNLVNPTGLLLSDSSITLPSPLPGGESPIRVPMAWGGRALPRLALQVASTTVHSHLHP